MRFTEEESALLNDQIVADEFRCTVKEARLVSWSEYHRALHLAEGRNLAEKDKYEDKSKLPGR